MAAAIGLIILLATSYQGVSASSRSILQAPAPAPAAAVKGKADGVVELTAAVATFVNGTALQLTGVPNTSAWVQFSPPRANSVDLSYLVSAATADSNGKFLGSPQAALSGSYSGNKSTVLLQLDAPKLDSMTNTLFFDYKVLPVNETGLLETGGTVNTLVAARNGAEGNSVLPLLPYVTPGSTTFYNATISIDVVGIQSYVGPQATQKAGLIRVPLGACCFGGWGWYGK